MKESVDQKSGDSTVEIPYVYFFLKFALCKDVKVISRANTQKLFEKQKYFNSQSKKQQKKLS